MYTTETAQTYSVATSGTSLPTCDIRSRPQLLPDRFGSTSVPNPAGVVDFGPESSTPTDIPSTQTTDSYDYEYESLSS